MTEKETFPPGAVGGEEGRRATRGCAGSGERQGVVQGPRTRRMARQVMDENDNEFDFYGVMRRERTERVGEFSRRKEPDRPIRPWAQITADKPPPTNPYSPREFIQPGPVGLRRTEAGRNELSFFLEQFDEASIAYVVRCTNK